MNKQQLIEKCIERTREYLKASIPENLGDFEIKSEGMGYLIIHSKDQYEDKTFTNESQFQVEFYI